MNYPNNRVVLDQWVQASPAFHWQIYLSSFVLLTWSFYFFFCHLMGIYTHWGFGDMKDGGRANIHIYIPTTTRLLLDQLTG